MTPAETVSDRSITPEAVSAAIWRQRYVLEVVLLKLATEEALAATGQEQWLAHAERELRLALDQARLEDLSVDARRRGFAGSDGEPEPWATVFDDHHRAVTELLGALVAAADRPTVLPMPGDARPTVRDWARSQLDRR